MCLGLKLTGYVLSSLKKCTTVTAFVICLDIISVIYEVLNGFNLVIEHIESFPDSIVIYMWKVPQTDVIKLKTLDNRSLFNQGIWPK